MAEEVIDEGKKLSKEEIEAQYEEWRKGIMEIERRKMEGNNRHVEKVLKQVHAGVPYHAVELPDHDIGLVDNMNQNFVEMMYLHKHHHNPLIDEGMIADLSALFDHNLRRRFVEHKYVGHKHEQYMLKEKAVHPFYSKLPEFKSGVPRPVSRYRAIEEDE